MKRYSLVSLSTFIFQEKKYYYKSCCLKSFCQTFKGFFINWNSVFSASVKESESLQFVSDNLSKQWRFFLQLWKNAKPKTLSQSIFQDVDVAPERVYGFIQTPLLHNVHSKTEQTKHNKSSASLKNYLQWFSTGGGVLELILHPTKLFSGLKLHLSFPENLWGAWRRPKQQNWETIVAAQLPTNLQRARRRQKAQTIRQRAQGERLQTSCVQTTH